MAGIWGYVDFKKNTVDNAVPEQIRGSLDLYKIDRVEELSLGEAYMLCAHQYVTEEAVKDTSPIYDADADLMFLGDCFLYNREDVAAAIIAKKGHEKYTDRFDPACCGDIEMAYMAYRVLGDEFVHVLRGCFSFAIYHRKEKKLDLFSDHFSARYLAYYLCEDYICFGSTYRPIKALAGKGLKLNHDFILSSYRAMAPRNFYNPKETVYEQLYHVDSAVHVTVNTATGEERRERYWDPTKNIKYIKKSDEECKELFLSTYHKIVDGMLRSRGEVGLLLSGGLDSSSVVAMAAPSLAAQGKKLYSYTSVPADGYQPEPDRRIIENESVLVEEQRKMFPNLEPHYVSGGMKDCLSTTKYYHRIYDTFVKASINNLNIDNMSEAAVKDNVKLLMTAAGGNANVSYGDICQIISMQILSGHPVKAYKEADAFCKRFQQRRGRFLRTWIKGVCKDLFTNPEEFSYYLRPSDRKRLGIDHAARDEKRYFGGNYVITEKQKNHFMFIPMQYIQRSFYFTVQGLRFGYLKLDPTLTVEMTELCISLPLESFVHGGVERRPVNGYMKELLPPIITHPDKPWGRQAADVAYRVNVKWDELKEDAYDILSEPMIVKYLDEKEVAELTKRIRENEYHLDRNTVMELVLVATLGYFLRDHRDTYGEI